MSEYIVDTFGIVQDFADLHGDMSTPLYRAIMNVMLSRQHEEIVRCRDCYFADEIEGGYWCDRFDCGKEHVTSNGFCAWAERKEGGDD